MNWLKAEIKSPFILIKLMIAYSAFDLLVYPPLVIYHEIGPEYFERYSQGHIMAGLIVVLALVSGYVIIADLRNQVRDVSVEVAELKRNKAERSEVAAYVRDVLDGITINGNNPGFIYVMRRSDGVLKLGKTNDVNRRRTAHQRDYGHGFKLVKRFAVPDQAAFERLALRMTSDYEHTEGRRKELRQMTDEQLSAFLAEFLLICQGGVDA